MQNFSNPENINPQDNLEFPVRGLLNIKLTLAGCWYPLLCLSPSPECRTTCSRHGRRSKVIVLMQSEIRTSLDLHNSGIRTLGSSSDYRQENKEPTYLMKLVYVLVCFTSYSSYLHCYILPKWTTSLSPCNCQFAHTIYYAYYRTRVSSGAQAWCAPSVGMRMPGNESWGTLTLIVSPPGCHANGLSLVFWSKKRTLCNLN